MDKKMLKKKISELIHKTETDITDMEMNTAPVSPENAIGRVSRMDAINNKSVVEAALRNKREKLSKLQIALSRIDKPEFGICSMCGMPIQEGRIIYMPESTRCIRCADK